MKGRKIRACQLQVNDIYVKLGREYIVRGKDDKCIYYEITSSTGSTVDKRNYIGANSQEWVLLVAKYVKKTKADTVPNIRVETVAGDFVGIFKTQKEATEKLNISSQHISRVFRKKTNNGCLGYVFSKV